MVSLPAESRESLSSCLPLSSRVRLSRLESATCRSSSLSCRPRQPTPWTPFRFSLCHLDYTSGKSELTQGRQHFNKKIWRDVVEKRGEIGVTSPAKTASPATPKKRGGRKKVKSQEAVVDSDTDLSETPSKKRKVSAKKGTDDDEDQSPVKKEVKNESI